MRLDGVEPSVLNRNPFTEDRKAIMRQSYIKKYGKIDKKKIIKKMKKREERITRRKRINKSVKGGIY